MDYIFGLFAKKQQGLFVVFLFYTLTHICFITLPPKGNHLWRQCNTSAVARNFVEEDMNIFHPRVDRRGDTNGITGMQFPSFEYTIALIAKVIGYYDGLNRLVAFLFFAMGIAYFHRLLAFIYHDYTIAFCGTWAFTFSPILYYHSVTALPDVLALSASIASLYYFFRWDENKKSLLLFFSLCFAILAGLTKIQYLAIGFPMVVIVFFRWRQKKYSSWDIFLLISFAFFTLCFSMAWYIYAYKLIKSSGLHDFGIELRPAKSFLKGLKILGENIYSHFPEQLLSFPNLIPLFVVIIWFWKTKNVLVERMWWIGAWVLGLLAYHLIELRQMEVHLYYMFPYLPLVFLLLAKGYGILLEKNKRLLVLLILISLPIIAFAGTFHHFLNEQKNIPRDFYNPKQRAAIDACIPDNALTIVGPDPSGCIYHYFTHTKGWSFTKPHKISYERISECIEKGATYLIWPSDLEIPSPVSRHILKKVNYQGTDLCIYLIH
ncbi:MAG TPA: hypothetical protein VK750_09980 [Cytophagaceae bacterium]|jgi:hypothetical protein|nr:hypothetical protein [Cytophagaceae bacterium]